jgi:hypothetical protein
VGAADVDDGADQASRDVGEHSDRDQQEHHHDRQHRYQAAIAALDCAAGAKRGWE